MVEHFRVFRHVGFFSFLAVSDVGHRCGEEVETTTSTAVQVFLLALACTRGQLKREWIRGIGHKKWTLCHVSSVAKKSGISGSRRG